MSFKNVVSRMDAACARKLGEVAIYDDGNGARKIRAIVDRDVEQLGAYDTHGSVRRHEASLLVSEAPNPKRGHTLEIENGRFIVDGIVSNDGYMVRVYLNED